MTKYDITKLGQESGGADWSDQTTASYWPLPMPLSPGAKSLLPPRLSAVEKLGAALRTGWWM